MLMGSYAHHSDIIQLATTQNMLVCKYLIGEITSVPDRISKNNVRLGIRMRENIWQYFEPYSIISSCFWSYNLTRLHAEAVPSRENRTDSWIFFKISFNLTNFAFAVSKRSFFTTSNECNLQLFRIILAPTQPHRFIMIIVRSLAPTHRFYRTNVVEVWTYVHLSPFGTHARAQSCTPVQFLNCRFCRSS